MAANVILCRYNEIATKGRNRGQFERLFCDGIARALKLGGELKFTRERGRFFAHLPQRRPFEPDLLAQIREALPRAFGLTSFSPGLLVEPRWEAIEAAAVALFDEAYELLGRGGEAVTFRSRARRNDKAFVLSSREIEIRLAEAFTARRPELRLDLGAAEITVGVEVRRKWAFVFAEEVDGPGGMPAGSNSPALGLLSGGIDSPVACYLAMRRGCNCSFITFHSHPYTPLETVDKVRRLVQVLNRWQKAGELLACNLAEAQKVIRDRCTERFRTVLYRRLMMRVAATAADELGLQALVTGESIGQVASQTVRNMSVIDRAAETLVLRPVLAMDKQEIVAVARRIGTYAISEVECPDSCTVFAPKSPATSVTLERIRQEEDALDMEALVRMSLAATVRVAISTGAEFAFEVRPERIEQVR